MIDRLKIGPRILLLIAAQTVVLLTIAITSIVGLDIATRSTEHLNRNVSEGTRLGYMAELVREDLISTIRDVHDGFVDWEIGSERLAEAQRSLDQDWSEFVAGLSADEREFVDDVLAPELEDVRQAFAILTRVFEARDEGGLDRFLRDDLDNLVQPFPNAVLASSAERQLDSARTFAEALYSNRLFLYSTVGVVIVGVLLAGLLGVLIYRSITRSIGVISNAVGEVSGGNYAVRTAMAGPDELGDLGRAFDALLEERVANLAKAQAENDQLNDSVIRLLEAVDELSRRDLSVEAPINPDVTGPVADAINKMAEEFTRVLRQVSRIASRVNAACTSVNDRAITVNKVAGAQRKEAELAASQLATASKALGDIAELARRCSEHAERTTGSVDAAMEAVQGTRGGMKEIRESIQETGKRIKRLGDRSQEITGVVEIISTIAERTHMLALNASMQAASAGEAGRGFGVVADEVQRLAESSREATRQITALVRNIQLDTNDAIVTMDKTISQVVEGTKLAESAGEQMVTSRRTTSELIETVHQIAAGSDEQSRISIALRSQSDTIVDRTIQTTKGMADQLKQTQALVHYSSVLNKAVGVFKLPAQTPAN